MECEWKKMVFCVSSMFAGKKSLKVLALDSLNVILGEAASWTKSTVFVCISTRPW